MEERGRRLRYLCGKRGANTLIPALLPLREKGPQGVHDGGRIIQRLLIAEAKDPITFNGQPFIPQGVVQLGLREIMPGAIQFDDEARAQMHEIGDVAADRNLPPEAQIRPAQGFPQHLFRKGHFPTQVACATNRAFRIPFHAHAP